MRKSFFLYVKKIFIVYFYFFLNYTFFLSFSDTAERRHHFKILLLSFYFFIFFTQKIFELTIFVNKKSKFLNSMYCNLLLSRFFFFFTIITICFHSLNFLILSENLYFWLETQFLFFFFWHKIDAYNTSVMQLPSFLEILYTYLILIYKDEFCFIQTHTKLPRIFL
ncbi:hypothetical protein CPARA_2gp245 (nucleomorph) [Cryptomonas paramecium]|uniref:Uncharacterized protein n=1 Tax=Cryptomonas paramaecium TaxID=2898 RepID=F2HHV7_9CRYP|nr:hypothetical protein CPARA_2gp245 [Cryptomonas paramecium]AEA38903.1 hypothetical protein CPARA_2gp245 [Cryptomonas paramecium]